MSGSERDEAGLYRRLERAVDNQGNSFPRLISLSLVLSRR